MRLKVYDGDHRSAGSHKTNISHAAADPLSSHDHYARLQDEDRISAFRQAIELTVEPGMRVVDLNGGTGILSAFAARRGATVTCVQQDHQLAEISSRFLEQNRFDDSVSVIHQDPFEFLPIEPVDVVICDMLQVAMLGQPQLQVIDSFKRRYRKAFGGQLPLFLPESAVLLAQPIQQSFGFAGYWAPIPMFQPPRLQNDSTDELAELTPYATVVYSDKFSTRFDRIEEFTLQETGTLNAIRFVTENVIALETKKGRAVTWPSQSAVLPIATPLRVRRGDTVNVGFGYNAGDSLDQLCSAILACPANSEFATDRVA